ncbi:MAG: hypothetical protein EPN94_07045 [Nitrospirae bacterium]|nr:MAG: hypothetical protein EPN94_07045 [Nitrospirota bacterium]
MEGNIPSFVQQGVRIKGESQMKILALIFTVMIFSASCTLPGFKKTTEVKPSEVTAHKDCNMCHLPHKMGGGILLSKPLSELCSSCHQARIGAGEHKVGIKPSMPTEGLPLDTDGKITCITCHDPHGAKGYESLLRAPSFTELCKKCHKNY